MYEFSFSLPVTNLFERFIVKNRNVIIHFSKGLVHPAQSGLKALGFFIPITWNWNLAASSQPPQTREEKTCWMLCDSNPGEVGNTSSQRSIHYTIVSRLESRGYSSMH